MPLVLLRVVAVIVSEIEKPGRSAAIGTLEAAGQ
jgi:hypothetical protein